ncbi:MAG: hypothetical protein VX669_12380, partial [Planctomycetota bacterium]|nr:hypothetical protein [Planctomycetota bacterium]
FALVRLGLTRLDDQQLANLGSLAGLKDNTWWDGLLTTVTAIVVGIAASFLSPAPRSEQLNGLLLVARPKHPIPPSAGDQ